MTGAVREVVALLAATLRDSLQANEIMLRGAPGLSAELRAQGEACLLRARAVLATVEELLGPAD